MKKYKGDNIFRCDSSFPIKLDRDLDLVVGGNYIIRGFIYNVTHIID